VRAASRMTGRALETAKSRKVDDVYITDWHNPREYDRAVKRILVLPIPERHAYTERLRKLRSRARPVGCGIDDELNSIWCEAGLGEHQGG